MAETRPNPRSDWACIDVLPAAYLVEPRGAEGSVMDSVFKKNNTHLFQREFESEQDIPYPSISWLTLTGADFDKFFDAMWNYKKFEITIRVYINGTSGSGQDQKTHTLDFNIRYGNFIFLESRYQFPLEEDDPDVPTEGFWHDWKIMHYDYDNPDKKLGPLFLKMLGLTKTASINNSTNYLSTERGLLSWDNNLVESHPFPTFRFSTNYKGICSYSDFGNFFATKNTSSITGMDFVDSQEEVTANNFPCEASFSIRSVFIDPKEKAVHIFFEFLLDSSIGCAVVRDQSSYPNSKDFDFKIFDKEIGRKIKLSYTSGMSITNALFSMKIEELERF